MREWSVLAPSSCNRVVFTPDSRRLLTAHEDGTICVFRVPRNLPIRGGFPPLDPAWVARTIKLPADEQIKEVTAELVRRNPGFKDPLNAWGKDAEGRVTGVSVETTMLEDISPFRGFSSLNALGVRPKQGIGKVWDLSGLEGMPLGGLDLRGNRVWDLTPLRDMPLTQLLVDGNPVCDLSPLQKMKLVSFGGCGTEVDDVAVFRGMPLESVCLHSTSVKDLSPLSEAPLKQITINPEWATDLAPLRDRPLEWVGLFGKYSPEQIYSAWPGLRRFPASWLDYNIRIVVMIRRVCGGVPGWLGIACN